MCKCIIISHGLFSRRYKWSLVFSIIFGTSTSHCKIACVNVLFLPMAYLLGLLFVIFITNCNVDLSLSIMSSFLFLTSIQQLEFCVDVPFCSVRFAILYLAFYALDFSNLIILHF